MDLERRMYLRLFSFCIGSAMDILSFFIDTCILNNTDFDLFLNKHKHELFHQYIPTIPCCECYRSVSLAAPNKRSILNISQMKTMYKLDGAEITGHVKTNHKKETSQHCLCKISALQGITTEKIDISLVHCLIKTCSSTIFAKVQNHLEVIRNIRNQLAHHDKRGIMTETDFNQTWNKMENAILAIAKEVSAPYARKEKKLISSLKKTDVNPEDVTDRIENMEEHMQEKFKMILDEQNRINDKSDETKQEILGALEDVKDDLSIEIKKLTFAVKLHGMEPDVKSETTETTLYQREVSEKCQVEWRLKTPDIWKVEQIKQTLKHASGMLSQWFHIEFIYVGSLVIQTSVPRHVLKDRPFLNSAIQSFLEKIVEVCEINTEVPEIVNVDFKVLDMFSNTGTTSAQAGQAHSKEESLDQLYAIEEEDEDLQVVGMHMDIHGRGRKAKRIPGKLRCESAESALTKRHQKRLQQPDIQRTQHDIVSITTSVTNSKGMLNKSVQTIEEWPGNNTGPISDTDELLFYLLCIFIVEIATDVFKEYFKAVVLEQHDLQSYLNRQRHIIFHLFDATKCCMCRDSERTATKTLSTKQFNAMFCYDEMKIKKSHVMKRKGKTEQKCICGLVAKEETNVSDIDVFFIRSISKKCGQPTNSNVDEWLGAIVETRKKIFHLSDAKAITCHNFENHWKNLLTSVKGLSKLVGNEFYFETNNRIAKLKTRRQLGPTDKLKQEELYQVEWQNKCAEFECLWTEERLKHEEQFENNYINFPSSSYELFLERIDKSSRNTNLDQIYMRMYGSNELLRVFLSEGPYVIGDYQTVPVWLKFVVPETWNTQQILDAIDKLRSDMPSGSQIKIKSCSSDDLNLLTNIVLRLLKDRQKLQEALQTLLYNIFQISGVDTTVKAEVDVLLIVSEVKRRKGSVQEIAIHPRMIPMTHT